MKFKLGQRKRLLHEILVKNITKERKKKTHVTHWSSVVKLQV